MSGYREDYASSGEWILWLGVVGLVLVFVASLIFATFAPPAQTRLDLEATPHGR